MSEAAGGAGAVTFPAIQARDLKAAILAVDDDPPVLAAIARDLRRQYGQRYRILRAPDGERALAAIEELILRGDPLALILADQRMPGLSGVELLARARSIQPKAGRVLLTAYADTDAAIAAINEVRLDHYILKPWDPPEDRLYPILDEILDDWEASFDPPFHGIRLIGHRWSPETHRIRDFLARNLVPLRWLDVDRDIDEAARLRQAAGVDGLPLVILPDGSHRLAPSNRELGVAIGLRSTSETTTFDLLVIGAGPAGLAAAVYGASEGLRTDGLESTLVLMRGKLRDTRVERDYAPDLPPVEVRGNELTQVWTNIIHNAIDATGGSGRLVIRTFMNDGRVVVELEDDGPGMPPAVAQRVFDPFFTTKPPGSGTGLGLNISHNIVVRQHAGQISVSSEPGRTCFRVELPLTHPRDEDADSAGEGRDLDLRL